MRFATPQGFNSGDQFFTYLKDTFDVLYAEGKEGLPKMMNRRAALSSGRPPGRVPQRCAVSSIMCSSHEKVWVPKRIDIARHWHEHHKPEGGL